MPTFWLHASLRAACLSAFCFLLVQYRLAVVEAVVRLDVLVPPVFRERYDSRQVTTGGGNY